MYLYSNSCAGKSGWLKKVAFGTENKLSKLYSFLNQLLIFDVYNCIDLISLFRINTKLLIF